MNPASNPIPRLHQGSLGMRLCTLDSVEPAVQEETDNILNPYESRDKR